MEYYSVYSKNRIGPKRTFYLIISYSVYSCSGIVPNECVLSDLFSQGNITSDFNSNYKS